MSNTITNVMPKILADGVMALREQAIFAQLVNRALQSDAQKKGNVVNVPIPSAIAARAVTPAVSFAANVDSAPTVALVTLDQWYEAPINLSDSDAASVDPMFLAMQASEAIKALANNVDAYIWGKHTGFYGYVGAAGTTPFQSSLTVAAEAAKRLNVQLAPNDRARRAVIDPSSELYLKLNAEVLSSEKRGDSRGIIEGDIGRKLGFDWYMDQNISTFTPGTGWVTGFAVSTTTGVAAASTLHVLNATASGTIKIGDVFTLGSDSKQYVVTANTTVSATVGVDITVYPPLSAAVSLGTTLAVVGTAYTVNIAFHRDAWAFASRPLQSVFQAGNVFQSPTDPVSGIALRLELSRQYKQETLSFDVLYGSNVIRPQLGVKIFG
jgi:hypothetical protein